MKGRSENEEIQGSDLTVEITPLVTKIKTKNLTTMKILHFFGLKFVYFLRMEKLI
jgi:hypothetical protein